jgi:1,4-dihydroxy-2-naphthoyl-CoA synthase
MSVIERRNALGGEDLLCGRADGLAKTTITRPEARSAARPKTATELARASGDPRGDEGTSGAREERGPSFSRLP